MKKNNILNDITILSVLGIPFFAVRDHDDIDELKAVVKFRPKIVNNLKLIEEPDLIWLEDYLGKIDEKHKKSKRWWSFNSIARDIVYIGVISYYLMFHLIYRIRYKKQICEEEILMFEQLTSEILTNRREQSIKLLSGITKYEEK